MWEYKGRPDTSRRQRRQLPPCPLVICLVALEMLQYKLAISSQDALYQEENALVPLPFQKRSIQPCIYPVHT